MRIQTVLQKLHETMNDYEISRRTGIPQPNINRIRNGKIKNPSYEIGVRIMALYNLFEVQNTLKN